MSINIPLGTYVSDGVRTGPFYTGQLPQGFVADANGLITSSSHDNYGPGVLLSTQHTYNITPAEPHAGFTTLNNLVASTPAAQVPGARDLILLGDNSVTFLNRGVVQFDWPRIPTVTITGVAAAPNTHVTIFGTDFYGFPLQHTYVVQLTGTYPDIDLANATVDIAAKAFYTVNRVFISAALPVGSSISLGCAEAYGLPYRINGLAGSAGCITSISFGGVSELSVDQVGINGTLITTGPFVPAEPLPSTSFTGDVRGFYATQLAANNIKKLFFTYYVEGADTWINQVANQQMLYKQQTGSLFPQGVSIAPLNVNDLFGVPQYYSGNPE